MWPKVNGYQLAQTSLAECKLPPPPPKERNGIASNRQTVPTESGASLACWRREDTDASKQEIAELLLAIEGSCWESKRVQSSCCEETNNRPQPSVAIIIQAHENRVEPSRGGVGRLWAQILYALVLRLTSKLQEESESPLIARLASRSVGRFVCVSV